MSTTPTPLPIVPAKNAQFVKPVKRGQYWVAQNTTTDLYFKFPGSRHNISPQWVKDPSEAAGFSERWAATWAAAQYGFKEDTR